MSGYKKLQTRIQMHYEELPKNYKRIAEYYLENFDNIPFLTAQQLAKATLTNDAAIVRFAQIIGFTGFSEMRDEIAITLRNRLKNETVFPMINPSKLTEDTLTAVANQDIKNISDTLNLNEKENYNKVIELIIKSERVFTIGLGISHLLAQIISYQLTQIGIFSSTLTNNQATFMEQILFMNQKDLIIALTFPPYSKDTIGAVKFAKGKKIKVISLTNKKSSPISFFTDAGLIIKSENMLFTNSFAAISVLINAIVTECALKNEVKAKKWRNNLKNVMKLQGNTIN